MSKVNAILLSLLWASLVLLIFVDNQYFFYQYPLENHAWRNTQTLIAVKNIDRGLSGVFQLDVFGDLLLPMEFPVYQYFVYLLNSIAAVFYQSSSDLIQISDTAKVLNLTLYVGMFVLPTFISNTYNKYRTITFSALALFLFNHEYMPLVVFSLVPDVLSAFFFTIFLLLYVSGASINRVWGSGFALLISALTKITTPLVLVFFYLMHTTFEIRKTGRLALNHIIIPVCFAAAILVYVGLDIYKESNIVSNEFTSKKLRGWNFGYLSQGVFDRFLLAYDGTMVWLKFFVAYSIGLMSVIWFKTKNPKVLVLLLSFISMPMVFVNLYGHNYYQIALVPLLITAIYLIDFETEGFKKMMYVLVGATVCLGNPLANKNMSHSQQTVEETINRERKNLSYQRDVALFLRDNRSANEYFIATGLGYSPLIPFLSGKKGVFFYPSLFGLGEVPHILESLDVKDISLYVDCGDDFSRKKIFAHFKVRQIMRYSNAVGICRIYEIV